MTRATTGEAENDSAYRWNVGLHVRLNMVVDVAGASVDRDGRSDGLSSTEDRRLLSLIRFGADVVIVGAQTIRAEGWHLPRSAVLVVLSRSGELPWETCPDATKVIVMSDALNGEDVVRRLVALGYSKLLVEGGSSVARWFAADNLLDDVCLTVRGSSCSPSQADLSTAIVGLLTCSPDQYHLVSAIPEPISHSVFTVWRRALGPQSLPTY
jgi:riboflavin biosynthesis pyrimidine reductase